MGYDLTIPLSLVFLLLLFVAFLLVKRRHQPKRLDFVKGTTYEKPLEEGAAEATLRDEAKPPP